MKFARRKVGVSWQETQTFMAGNPKFTGIFQYKNKVHARGNMLNSVKK